MKEKYANAVLHVLYDVERSYPDREYTRVEISPGVKVFSVLVTTTQHRKGVLKIDYGVDVETGRIVSKEEILR